MTGTLVAVIAAVAAPLGAYIIAARRFSGRIESSDAKELWEESKSIREWSRERMEAQGGRIAALEGRLAEVERANNELMRENLKLTKESALLRDINLALREEVSDLTRQLETCKQRIAELEGESHG